MMSRMEPHALFRSRSGSSNSTGDFLQRPEQLFGAIVYLLFDKAGLFQAEFGEIVLAQLVDEDVLVDVCFIQVRLQFFVEGLEFLAVLDERVDRGVLYLPSPAWRRSPSVCGCAPGCLGSSNMRRIPSLPRSPAPG